MMIMLFKNKSIFSSGSDRLFAQFGKGHYSEHLYEMTLNLDWWLRRQCHLKLFIISNHAAILVFKSYHIMCVFDRGNYRLLLNLGHLTDLDPNHLTLK